jgi:hypothetical protein
VGIVATLTSTTPVLILPLIWIVTGKAPALPGWRSRRGAVPRLTACVVFPKAKNVN